MKPLYCICVDGGTTNTRATLLSAPQNVLAVAKRAVGVRNTSIDGNNAALKSAVKECLLELLALANCNWDSIGCIVASGMITSNLGIYEVPHLTAPANISQFSEGIQSVLLQEIAPLPFHFVPGLKNLPTPLPSNQFSKMDIMRGEEVETIALFSTLPENTGCVLILPGSHTKFVFVNEKQEITGCLTTLSGEILSLLTQQSILSETVGARFAESASLDLNFAKRGFWAAKEDGLARTAFSCRIGGLFTHSTKEQMASFLLGAILQQDIWAFTRHIEKENTGILPVYIAGKHVLREALHCLLLESNPSFIIHEIASREDLAAFGCLEVAKKKGLLPFFTTE